MSLDYCIKKKDETKPDTDEENLVVEIMINGERLCDESSVEDIKAVKRFVKGVYSGRIKRKPIA